MSNTPPDEFKPRSHWGRMPSRTFSLSPNLPSAKPAPAPARQKPASSILSGSALPVGPRYVPPPPAPEPEPPPVAIWRDDVAPPEAEPPLLDEVTIVAPRRARGPKDLPWLVGGAVIAVAIVGAALLLRPQPAPIMAEPALAPVAAAPAPAPIFEALEPAPVAAAEPVVATPPRQVAAVTRTAPTPRPAASQAVELPSGPVAYGPQPAAPTPAPTPAPTTRLESVVPTPIQPAVVRPPVDPSAPVDTNDSY